MPTCRNLLASFPGSKPRMHLTHPIPIPIDSGYCFDLWGSLWCNLMHLLAKIGCNTEPQEHGWVGRTTVENFCQFPLPSATQMFFHILSFSRSYNSQCLKWMKEELKQWQGHCQRLSLTPCLLSSKWTDLFISWSMRRCPECFCFWAGWWTPLSCDSDMCKPQSQPVLSQSAGGKW